MDGASTARQPAGYRWQSSRRFAKEWLRRVLMDTVDSVWLRQLDNLRVRVSSSERDRVLGELEQGRVLSNAARRAEPGAPRDALAAAALRNFLLALGRAAEPDAP